MGQHKGWLEVQSALGKGSTFLVYLPAVHEPKAQIQQTEAARPLPCGQETILLVEDEDHVRDSVERTLAGCGYTVLKSSYGRQALEVWEKHSEAIHLLVTDVVMPGGMSGVELAVRLSGAKAGLRVILMSGHSVEVAGHELEISGKGFLFLQKPFSGEVLAETVRGCLDEERG